MGRWQVAASDRRQMADGRSDLDLDLDLDLHVLVLDGDSARLFAPSTGNPGLLLQFVPRSLPF